MEKRTPTIKICGIGILILITVLGALKMWDMYGSDSFQPANAVGLLGMQSKSKAVRPTFSKQEEPLSEEPVIDETTLKKTPLNEEPTVSPAYHAPGVYIEEIPLSKPITGVTTDITAFIGVTEVNRSGDIPLLIHSFTEYQSSFGGYLPESCGQYRYLPCAVESYFQNGGTACYIVSITPENMTNIDPEEFTDLIQQSGVPVLEQLEDVSIVVMPGVHDETLQQTLIDHCEAMGDRFAILDMPETIEDIHDLREHRDRFDSSNAAFYHPWLQISDPEHEGSMYIPPSGAVAGVYAATDHSRGVHKAPANEPVRGITGLKYTITENEHQTIYPYGINPIRHFPGRGTLVSGARTCSSNEEFRYVNVKRYFMYLHESIQEGTKWIVFEPNDERLWATVTQSIESFLYAEWHKGALMGTKPDEAYFVRMDRSTMTPDDLQQGKRIILLGASALRPAEFIILRVAQQ